MPPSSLLSNVPNRFMKQEPSALNNSLSLSSALPFLLPSTSIPSFPRFPTNVTMTSSDISRPKDTSALTVPEERKTVDSPISSHDDHGSRSYLLENIKSEYVVNPNDKSRID